MTFRGGLKLLFVDILAIIAFISFYDLFMIGVFPDLSEWFSPDWWIKILVLTGWYILVVEELEYVAVGGLS